jgi:hypothetical protein
MTAHGDEALESGPVDARAPRPFARSASDGTWTIYEE